MRRPRISLGLHGLGHAYGARETLAALDLVIEPGQVTAIVGPNGAGKTTLLNLLAGVLQPTTGRVEWGGRPLASIPVAERAHLMALVGPETSPPFPWSALEVVLMGRSPHLALRGLEQAEDLAFARTALARLDVANLEDRRVTTLSQGELQRVLLARGLCQDTPVLLLDEPTSHLDPAHALAVAALLRELTDDGGTVVAVLHDLNLAARAAHRLIFLAEGRLRADGPPRDTLVPSVIQQVFGVASRRIDGPVAAILLGEDEGQR